MNPDCLYLASPLVAPFVNKYGVAGTYRIYAEHNFWLPDFQAYQQQNQSTLVGPEAADRYLSSLINQNLFDVRPLDQLEVAVPKGTEAAFYQDAFYFGDQISRGALSEEVFHSIFQRLIPQAERDQLYTVGKSLLKAQLKARGYSSLASYYQAMVARAPQTYRNLSEEKGYNRLYEEALAQEFVRYATYGPTKQVPYRVDIKNRLSPYLGQKTSQAIQKLLDKLFRGLQAMTNFFQKNRLYADQFFQKINSGVYQTARIVEPGYMNTVPTTRLIELLGGKKTLSSAESSQLIRNMGGLMLQLRDNEELGELPEDQLLNLVFASFATQYRATSNGEDIASVLEPTQYNDDTYEEEPNPEYSKIREDVKTYLADLASISNLISEEEEDELGSGALSEFAGYDREANEVGGWSGMSKWIKQYIGMTGTPRLVNGQPQFHSILVPGQTVPYQIPVIDIVDPDKVYYGLARSISNTSDLRTRLEKLLLYTSFTDTPATSAFATQLLKDLAPVTYQPTELLEKVLQKSNLPPTINSPKKLIEALREIQPEAKPELLLKVAREAFTSYRETNPDVIRQQVQSAISANTLSTYLSPGGKQVLIRVLKGFDLWSRTMINMRVDPSKGLSVASNANRNRASLNLLGQWEKNYNERNLTPSSLPKAYASISFLQPKESLKAFQLLPMDQQVARLDQAFQVGAENLQNRFAQLGVTLSQAYIQYGFYQQAKIAYVSLPALQQTKAFRLDSLFQVNPDKLISRDDLVQAETFINDPKLKAFSRNSEKEGMRGRLETLAEGNSFFDENAFESNYQNAEGKTIYSYQQKTYSLDLQNSFLQTGLTRLRNLFETGNRVLLRMDEQGNPVYLQEGKWALTRNGLLEKLFNDPFYQDNHELFTSFTVDGVIQTELKRADSSKIKNTKSIDGATSGEGVTYGSMTPSEFDLFNLNSLATLSIQKGGRTISPVFLGNRETSRTGEYQLVPFLEGLYEKGKLTQAGVQAFMTEIEKEYNRIRQVSKDLDYTTTGNRDKDGNEIYTATLRDLNGDVLTNYHTGSALHRMEVLDGNGTIPVYIPTAGKDYRGLQFSDSVIGLLGSYRQAIPTTDMANSLKEDNLVLQALMDKPFPTKELEGELRDNITKILKAHFDLFETEGLWDRKKKAPSKLLDKSLTGERIAQKILSDFLNGLYLGQLAYGDAAMLYKNDGVDIFKRLKGLNAAIVSFAVPIAAPELGIYTPSTHYRKITVAEPKAKSDVSGSKIDLADAQGWQGVQTRRMSLYGQGKLSAPVARILDDIQEGKPITPAQMKTLKGLGVMFNSEKTVGPDGSYYVKLSETLLSKELTADRIPISQEQYEAATDLVNTNGKGYDQYGRTRLKPGAPEVSSYVEDGVRKYYSWRAKPHKQNLNDLRLKLEGFSVTPDNQWEFQGYDKVIHLATPISASKTLNPNVHTDVTGDVVNWKTVQEKNVYLLDLNYYGLQTENPSGKEKIVDPTQMLEIIANELGDVIVYQQGKLLSKTEIEPLWQQYLASRDKVNYQIASKVFEDESGNLDMKAFRQKAYEQVVTTGSDKQTSSMFDSRANLNLNLPLTRDKFISLFFSHFSKEVLSHKRAGDALAHVSSYGHELIKKVYRNAVGELTWDVIRDGSPEYQDLLATGQLEDLPTLSAYQYKHQFEGSGKNKKRVPLPGENSWFTQAGKLLEGKESVIVRDTLRHLKPRWETINGKLTQTGYFSEALMPIHDSRIQDLTPALKYSFGVRIPSQDKHSAINVEWVDTLPVFMGSSIVAPKEIVELSGSDFDIDKLYLTKPEGYWKGTEFIPYGTATSPKGEWDEFQQYVLSHYKPIQKYLKEQLSKDTDYQTLQVSLDLNRSSQEDDLGKLSKDSLLLYLLQTPGALKASQKQRYTELLEKAFQKFGLPATQAELSGQADQWNVGLIHNRMLAIQQGLLANDTTLDDNDPNGGQYNQPAALDALNDLKKEAEDGVLLFGETATRMASFWPMVHSKVHEKNQVGKALIGIGVNTNLFLINAVKLGFTVHPDYLPALQDGRSHSGTYGNRIQNPDGSTTRVFDIMSSIITADTDEAKEALNAFFKMSTDGQAVVMHMVGLGYTLLDSLLVINQPVIQDYIALSDKQKAVRAGRGIINPTDENLKFLNSDGLAKQVLGVKPEDTWGGEVTPYSPQLLRTKLAASKTGRQEYDTTDQQILKDFMNLVSVNEYAANFVRFIKLKKGFGQDLPSFDQLQESALALGFGKDLNFPPPINIKDRVERNPKLAAQILGMLNPEGILDQSSALQRELFFRRSAGYNAILEPLSQAMVFRGAKPQENLNQAVESFILSKLYQSLFEDGKALSRYPKPDLGLVYQDGGEKSIVRLLQNFQAKYGYTRTNEQTGEIEQGIFANNSVTSLLIPQTSTEGTATIKLNTIVKLRPEQQEGLLDAFRELYSKENQPMVDGVTVGAILANDLINYFMVKDGFQFTINNISKLFSAEVFEALSQELNDFQARNHSYPLDQWSTELLTSLGRNTNYQEFLPTLKQPTAKEIKSLLDQSGMLSFQNNEGKVTPGIQATQLMVKYPEVEPKDMDTVLNATGFSSDEVSLVFPRFLQTTFKSDEGNVRKTYELVQVRDLTHADIQEGVGEKGTKALYVEVIPSGAKGISPATGLGQHYTESRRSEINKRLAQSPSGTPLHNYYQTIRAEEAAQPVVHYSGNTVNKSFTKPVGIELMEGVYVNQQGLSQEEQLELFTYLKPFLEEQAAKTNKGKKSNIMMGLGLRWDYKTNNTGLNPVDVGPTLAGYNEPYGYYTKSINGKDLPKITDRIRKLLTKATGVDTTDYDAAIINLYTPDTFIPPHPDKSEAISTGKYPVVAVNIGGSGNFTIGDNTNSKTVQLQAGAGYVFGVEGKNRKQFHQTQAEPITGFLPSISLSQMGVSLRAGGYRITITLRRVMPLTDQMPLAPKLVTGNSEGFDGDFGDSSGDEWLDQMEAYNSNQSTPVDFDSSISYLRRPETPTSYANFPQQIPSEPEQTIGSQAGLAALSIIRGSSPTSPETTTTKLSKDQQWDRDRAIKEREEKTLTHWLQENPQYWITEKDFTAKWKEQGEVEGAEHQVYFQDGYAYKRNNLTYHTTWYQYFDRVALHNWLFPDSRLEIIGFTQVGEKLQPVIRQRIISISRGASRSEVEMEMRRLGFTRTKNDDYQHTSKELLLEDLHDENAVLDQQGDLIIFDPVIYRQAPVDQDESDFKMDQPCAE